MGDVARPRSVRLVTRGASHASPMKPIPYGGSVTTASMLHAGRARMTSTQSPWYTVAALST